MIKFLILIGVYSIAFLSLVYVDVLNNWDANGLAIMKMSIFLSFLWIIIWGTFQYFFKDIVRKMINMTEKKWKKKFFVLCIILVWIEEAIAVTMTNNVVQFWWEPWKAFITASTNYFEVIFLHSIIVFIPMFYAWILLLKKYDFSTAQVLFFFWISWIIWEIFMNPIALISWFWIFIYGLMIALPVYCLPKRNLRKPWFTWYVWALILPTLFSLPAVWIALILQDMLLR